MQNSIISVRPNSVFTALKYISQPCQIYKLWQVVFREKEVEFEGNPIGVVIQIYGDGECELRADTYGNVCYTEIRPATYTQIAQYRPDLLQKLVRETYLTEIDKETAQELFPNYAIFYDNDRAIEHRSWWSEKDRHQFPETTGKYYILTDTLKKMDIPYMHVTAYTKNQLTAAQC
jgi:hypothetical protein